MLGPPKISLILKNMVFCYFLKISILLPQIPTLAFFQNNRSKVIQMEYHIIFIQLFDLT